MRLAVGRLRHINSQTFGRIAPPLSVTKITITAPTFIAQSEGSSLQRNQLTNSFNTRRKLDAHQDPLLLSVCRQIISLLTSLQLKTLSSIPLVRYFQL
jgi:hypothetical protein